MNLRVRRVTGLSLSAMFAVCCDVISCGLTEEIGREALSEVRGIEGAGCKSDQPAKNRVA